MGILSKKKNINFYRYTPIVEEPLKKTKYYNSNVYKNDTQKAFTRMMIANDSRKLSPKANMKDLINKANTLHENPIMFSKENFRRRVNVNIVKFNIDSLKTYIRNYKDMYFGELIDYTYDDGNNRIANEYVLRFQFDSFNSLNLRGVYDNYVIDTTFADSFLIVSESNPNPSKYYSTEKTNELKKKLRELEESFTADSPASVAIEIGKLKDEIDTYGIPHRIKNLNIGESYTPSSLGFIIDVEEYFESKIFIPLEKLFTSTYNTGIDDVSYEVIYTNTAPSQTQGMTTLSVTAKFKWWANRNGVNLTYTTDVSNVALHLDWLLNKKNLVWVKYKTTYGYINIAYFELNNSVATITPTFIRISSLLALKGEGADEKNKYWKKVMLNNNYLSQKKKKPSFQRQDTEDIYTQLQNEDAIEFAHIYMTMNLTPLFLKKHRNEKEWQLYFKAFVKYFEQYTDYTDDIRSTKALKIKIPQSDSEYRIRIAKKHIRDNVIHKKMFISTEPNWYKPCMYLNIPDFDHSTEEEKSKGIFHYYYQYIFDLEYYWTQRVIGEYLPNGFLHPLYNNKLFHTYSIGIKVVPATEAEVANFEYWQNQKWYNTGVINPKVVFKYFANKLWREETLYLHPFKSHLEQIQDKLKEIRDANPTNVDSEGISHSSILTESNERNKVLQGIHLYSIDDMDIIPPLLDTKKVIETFPTYDLSYLYKYIPPMPTLLWYRTPYIAKLEIFLSQLWIDLQFSYVVKVGTFFSKILGLVLVIVGTILMNYFGGNPFLMKFGQSLIFSGMGMQISQLGGVFKIVGLIMAIQSIIATSGGSVAGFLKALGENTVITASQLISVVSSGFDIVLSTLTTEENARLKAFLEASDEEKKKIDEEINEMLGAVPLRLFDVNADMMSNIDTFYETMYGTPLYDGYDLLYETNQSMTDYDRLK